MVKVFGEKMAGFDYKVRKCVYAIVLNTERDKVLTVQTSKGHYFYLVVELKIMKAIKSA